ncbi:MAG: ABC transporter ATP-binding protein [Ignavibacteriae bacterium]|nr:ABC transporter ATP-binding protein [Ignavibacteriota bacterium]
MSLVTLLNLSKHFKSTAAVQDVNLDIRSGEFFSILGPSGCGKTTLLRMIAGFEQPTTGAIFINGSDVTQLPPQERGIGMVFQNYELFPHMTVGETGAFGLETQRLPKGEIRSRVERILDAVKLVHKIDVPVPRLSGGEQQRVAVARAIVVEPAVLLFDEPLSNLDVSLRVKTREEIRALQRRTGITTIYVTHDQAEAMSLSDRIGVIRAGQLVQVGTPEEMYEMPQSAFVAEFLGGANVLQGQVALQEFAFVVGEFRIAVPPTTISGLKNGDAALAVKPEAIALSPTVHRGEYEGRIFHREYLGFITNFVVHVQGVDLHVSTMSSAMTKETREGAVVGLSFDWSRCLLMQR